MQTINNDDFGLFLTQLRKEKGLTQQQLAEHLYISNKAISKWERGLSFPDISLLIPLAKILDVTTTELLSGKRIELDTPFTVQEVENLMTKTISYSKDDKTRIEKATQRRKNVFYGTMIVYVIEIILLYMSGCTLDNLLQELGLITLLMTVFAIYFTFFVKSCLPIYYDDNKINYYSDGIFKIHMIGLRFNNRNWQHILNVVHISIMVILVLYPLLYLIMSYYFPMLWHFGKYICLISMCVWWIVSVYYVGNKYK